MSDTQFTYLNVNRFLTARSQKAVTPNDDADLPDGPCAALMVTADGDVVCLAVEDAGTNEIQELDFQLITAGTFTLSFLDAVTTVIDWGTNDSALLDAIQDALERLQTLGIGWVSVTAGTLASGLGTVLVEFSGGNVRKTDVDLLVADTSDLEASEGDTPDIVITEDTPGLAPEDEDSTAATAHSVTWAGQVAGQIIPVQVRRVMEATTADVVALY